MQDQSFKFFHAGVLIQNCRWISTLHNSTYFISFISDSVLEFYLVNINMIICVPYNTYIEDISWAHKDTNFICECWNDLPQVSIGTMQYSVYHIIIYESKLCHKIPYLSLLPRYKYRNLKCVIFRKQGIIGTIS